MNLPGPEARIAAQESLTTILHAKIEQIAQDIRQIAQDKTGWKEVDTYLKLVATKDDLKTLATKEDVSKLEAGIKDDMTAMESRIKEDTGAIETRLNRIEATQEQILQLLQQKSGE